MPSPKHSIVFWTPPFGTTTDITVGKVVIPEDGTSGRNWVVATTANRAGRRSEGVAISEKGGSGFGTFEVAQVGTIDASISGLGTAVGKSLVRCSATGTCERVSVGTVDTDTDDIIGYAEEDGRVHLYIGFPFSEIISLIGGTGVPLGWFDVTQYGAVGDGVTDDIDAVMAAIADMSDDQTGGVLYFPPGNYYLAGDLDVYKQMEVRGQDGGVGNTLAKLTFAPGYGVVTWHQGSPYGGIASGTSVRHLSIVSTHLTLPEWAATTSYGVGDKVHVGASDCNWAYLECLVAGTSGGTAPADIPLDHDISAPFSGSTVYYDRQLVKGAGITSVVFEVTTAGTSGGSEPSWDTTLGNTTVSGSVTFTARSSANFWLTDGTVVWSTKCHNGIRVCTRTYIDDVHVYGFTNAGVYVRASGGTPFSNANHWNAQNVRIVQCGIGMMVSGGDTNVGSGINIDVESAGYKPGSGWIPGNGGCGIWDKSFLGCTWVACHVANGVDVSTGDGGGASYRGGGGASYSVFTGCYAESYAGRTEIACQMDTPAVMLGGNNGAGFASNSTTATTIYDGNSYGARNLVGKTYKSGGGFLYSYIGSQGAGMNVFRWNASGDAYYMNLGYSSPLTGWPDGWWAFGHNEVATEQAFCLPGEGAQWPSGASVGDYNTPWFPGTRFLLGPYTTDPQSIGVGNAAPVSGYHVQGSLVLNTGATVGAFGWICTATGTPGTWAALDGGGGGEANTASNIGFANGEVFSTKSGVDLEFRTLAEVAGIAITTNASTVDIGLDGIAAWGSDGQSIRKATGSNAFEWYTPSTGGDTPTGSAGELQTTNGSDQHAAATNVLAGTEYIAFALSGSSTSAAGTLRHPYNGGGLVNIITALDSDTTTTRRGVSYGPGDQWNLGNNAQDTVLDGDNTTVSGDTTLVLDLNGTAAVTIDSTDVGYALPRLGNGTPFASEGSSSGISSSIGGTITTECENVAIVFTDTASGTFTIPNPGSLSQVYRKLYFAAAWDGFSGGGATITLTCGSGTTTLALTRDAAWHEIIVYADNIYQMW